jgi:ferrous iron transport protein A
MSDRPLLQLERGHRARIIGFSGGQMLAAKLRQLGIAPGVCVRVVRVAPLKGPVLIEVNGRSIALGRQIASQVLVAEDECDSL